VLNKASFLIRLHMGAVYTFILQNLCIDRSLFLLLIFFILYHYLRSAMICFLSPLKRVLLSFQNSSINYTTLWKNRAKWSPVHCQEKHMALRPLEGGKGYFSTTSIHKNYKTIRLFLRKDWRKTKLQKSKVTVSRYVSFRIQIMLKQQNWISCFSV